MAEASCSGEKCLMVNYNTFLFNVTFPFSVCQTLSMSNVWLKMLYIWPIVCLLLLLLFNGKIFKNRERLILCSHSIQICIFHFWKLLSKISVVNINTFGLTISISGDAADRQTDTQATEFCRSPLEHIGKTDSQS